MRALTTPWFACMMKETSRRGVGTALFSGMIAASFLGIFLVPLYFVFQRMRGNVDSGASTPGRGETRSLTDDTDGDLRCARYVVLKIQLIGLSPRDVACSDF